MNIEIYQRSTDMANVCRKLWVLHDYLMQNNQGTNKGDANTRISICLLNGKAAEKRVSVPAKFSGKKLKRALAKYNARFIVIKKHQNHNKLFKLLIFFLE